MKNTKMKLIIAVFVLQLCFAGFHIVSRVALNIGVSKVVYPVYRNLIALLLLAPFSYFYEKKERPPVTFSLLFQFFVLALVGITANQGFYILGLYYATPSFASAMQNSVPAITFVMAFASGLETVKVGRRDGLAKVIGTLASVGGATVITIYKGPPLLHQGESMVNHSTREEDVLFDSTKMLNWTWGCIYLLGHCLSWAGWMVFQAPVVKKYPAKFSLTSFTCFFGFIQFMVIAAFFERDPNKWKIQSKEEIFLILYAGIISSGIVIFLQTWCIQKGRLLGAILIMIGLYSVLWGKKEEKKIVVRQEEKEDPLTKHLLDSNTKIQDSTTVSDIP